MEGYSPEEWDNLQFAMVLVGAGTAWADGKPKGKELKALRDAFSDPGLPRGELSLAVFESISREYDGVLARLDADPREPHQILTDARDLVDAQATADEAQSYKATAYAIGWRVAQVSGLLTVSSARAKERQVLAWASGMLRYVREVDGWTLSEFEAALSERGVTWSDTSDKPVHALGDPVANRFYFRGGGSSNDFELIVYESPAAAERRCTEIQELAGKRDWVAASGNVVGVVVGRWRTPGAEHPLARILPEIGAAPERRDQVSDDTSSNAE